NPKRIMCIVTDPNTNEILASVVNKGFDPNTPYVPSDEKDKATIETLSDSAYVNFLSQMWRNPLVSNTYEMGSIFKVLVGAAALDEKVIGMNDTLYCPGYKRVEDDVLVCHDGYHGTQYLGDALGNSCNVAFMTLGLNLGKTRFYNYIKAFGLDTITGVDYPAETNAQVKSIYNVYGVDIANMAFGQGIAVSPIQYITAANAVINGGYLLKPRYVSELVDSSTGKVVQSFDREIIRQVISKQSSDEMRDMLEYTINNGTAGKAYIAGYRVGGKTGTAQKAVGGSYGSATLLSFYAAAPMDDPKVSVLVVIDETENFEYSANVAAPFCRDVLSKTLPYLGVEARYTENEKNYQNTTTVTVPDVTGMHYETAIGYLAPRGYECKAASAEDEGVDFEITAQYPLPGTKTTKGTTVYVYRG
ncbi:MAG: PASTA domain-containing protein, partial [Clostridia bacterium]|nr:PASTA domain-containing protein [Clostridia bacterium]